MSHAGHFGNRLVGCLHTKESVSKMGDTANAVSLSKLACEVRHGSWIDSEREAAIHFATPLFLALRRASSVNEIIAISSEKFTYAEDYLSDFVIDSPHVIIIL